MVSVYDTTLRDGMQGEGMSLSVDERVRVAHALDSLGAHLIEAGFPASNPKEEALFELLGGESFETAEIVAFGMTRRRDATAEEDPGLRLLADCFAPVSTLQFGLMPILFPFLVLIYTEAATLLFILLMMYFTLTKRYRLGGLAGLAACLIRQNSIPWVLFAMLLSYLDERGWNLPLRGDWRVLLGKYWTFILTGALFVAFMLANGGVALGDEGSHPLGSIHLTNVFFLLFLTFFMFLPSWIARRREIRALLRRREAWLGLIMLFFTFWFGFINDHHYNTDYGYYFLRNAILIYFSSGGFQKFLFFIPVALAALWLWVVPLRRNWWLLYPFTVLALLPAWLVEQRYYLISLTLFLLAREPESRAVEYLQLALFAALALPIFIVIERQWWFL